jgi:fructokinase
VDRKKPVIVGVGEILWDMLPDGKVLGGAPANFAYHCNQLGAESHVISAIGNDPLGQEILKQVKALGLTTGWLFMDDHLPTSTVTVKLDAKGHPAYSIHEHVAWDAIPHKPGAIDLMAGADAVCYGSLAQRSPASRNSIQAYISAAPAHCLRVFDVNLRQHYFSRELLEASLDFADILKLNDEELVIVSELLALKGDEDELIVSMQQTYNLELIALTRGSEGSTLFWGSQRSDYRSDAVRAVDTVGAGDSFTAAMVMTYLKGMKLKEMHRIASELAAYVCTRKGATPEIPSEIISAVQN